MKLPKKYIILEIVPTNFNKDNGFIAQIQALRIDNKNIIKRLNLRVKEELIHNQDLLNMISYDKEQFNYVEKNMMMGKLKEFINNDLLLITDNSYTLNYLEDIPNKKELVFNYLNMEYGYDVFDRLIEKYKLVPSNHLVDLVYEALIFEE